MPLSNKLICHCQVIDDRIWGLMRDCGIDFMTGLSTQIREWWWLEQATSHEQHRSTENHANNSKRRCAESDSARRKELVSLLCVLFLSSPRGNQQNQPRRRKATDVLISLSLDPQAPPLIAAQGRRCRWSGLGVALTSVVGASENVSAVY